MYTGKKAERVMMLIDQDAENRSMRGLVWLVKVEGRTLIGAIKTIC
ncbi:MAG TPA: hypothetical protein VIM87_21605 [Chitinophaga sp.]